MKFDISDLNGDRCRRTFEVTPEEGGLRLDRFLLKRLHWMSRTAVQRLIAGGAISGGPERMDGARLRSAVKVAPGDRIVVDLPKNPKDEDEARRSPPLAGSDTLYEDAHILVLNKPAGVPVHPVGRNLHRTILTALHARYRKPADPGQDVVPSLVHRLDLETSGVLLVAKDAMSSRNLTAQFRERRVRKEYIALVYGLMEREEGEIRLPLGPDEETEVPYKQAVKREGGRQAITRYRVLRRSKTLTLVQLHPLTGRKHQLRVHLAALNHPIVGDKIYGPGEHYYFKARYAPPDADDLRELLLPRQALHASRLTVEHPVHQRSMRFEAPLPGEFEALLRECP